MAHRPSSESPAVRDPRIRANIDRYWRSNVTIMIVLLAVWALAGLGCGVIWADWLNQFRLGGFPLGFWFAQQGSIIIFVLLILIYAVLLNRLDRKHKMEIQALITEMGLRQPQSSEEGKDI